MTKDEYDVNQKDNRRNKMDKIIEELNCHHKNVDRKQWPGGLYDVIVKQCIDCRKVIGIYTYFNEERGEEFMGKLREKVQEIVGSVLGRQHKKKKRGRK